MPKERMFCVDLKDSARACDQRFVRQRKVTDVTEDWKLIISLPGIPVSDDPVVQVARDSLGADIVKLGYALADAQVSIVGSAKIVRIAIQNEAAEIVGSSAYAECNGEAFVSIQIF
ncbi:MAG: hypothetical protein R3E02_14845 [Blastomonas sp.]